MSKVGVSLTKASLDEMSEGSPGGRGRARVDGVGLCACACCLCLFSDEGRRDSVKERVGNMDLLDMYYYSRLMLESPRQVDDRHTTHRLVRVSFLVVGLGGAKKVLGFFSFILFFTLQPSQSTRPSLLRNITYNGKRTDK